jgi:hypothetical protein
MDELHDRAWASSSYKCSLTTARCVNNRLLTASVGSFGLCGVANMTLHSEFTGNERGTLSRIDLDDIELLIIDHPLSLRC